MRIYFLSSQPEICQIFQHNLQEHQCFIFSNLEPVVDLIDNKRIFPDLIIADFICHNHDFFNVFKQMNKYSKHIPLIYYNDPVVTANNRVLHWKMSITLSDIHKENLKLKEYEKILTTISNLVESPKLKPYIKLMQEPKPLPKNLLINELYNDYEYEEIEARLYKIKKMENMTESLFFLLTILFKLQNCPCKLDDILEEYKKAEKEMKIESLKVKLSRLNTIIKKHPELRITINKSKSGIQLVEF